MDVGNGRNPAADDEPDTLDIPRYPGDDTRPTSSKELAGWYMYAFAAETYVICASFIPILLETLARENGVSLTDPTKSCKTSSSKDDDSARQCVVYILGIPVNTASFAMYTFSVSVLLQAFLVVSISCFADHGAGRKKMLLVLAWIGSFCVMCFLAVSKSTYLLGALLTIISNTAFGASFVLLNSFLPLLVRHHPEVLAARRTVSQGVTNGHSSEPAQDTNPDDSTSALLGEREDDFELAQKPAPSSLTSVELRLSTQISARGIGIGYSSALFVQCMAIVFLVLVKDATWSQRVVLCAIGAWWAVFTIPSALWLRPRPGPPLPAGIMRGGRASWVPGWVPYVLYSWKSLWNTVKLARQLPDILLFLAGWFLLSDAVATTSSTAILFAKVELGMETWALGLINVISTTAGVCGALGWAWVSRKLQLEPHQTILACIALFELIPIYGLLGYLPFVQSWGVFGLQQPWEMYPLAAVYGLVLGGLGGYCRSLYGELIPPGSEAAFYALYAITDKGSSVFGPAIVAAIIGKSGDIRPAFWFLMALVGLPAPLIYFIKVERGKRSGEDLAEAIEGFALSEEEAYVAEEIEGMLPRGEHDDSRARGE